MILQASTGKFQTYQHYYDLGYAQSYNSKFIIITNIVALHSKITREVSLGSKITREVSLNSKIK